MNRPLAEYHRKRQFSETPEPRGTVRASGETLHFVIQKHDASHLHYDFRLELDGSLKSWAVPKGPSLNPADKRLAVQVEDHPLDYANFEGVIPKGHYGAGTVLVWDHGTWQPIGDANAGLRKGKLKFHLEGVKLHGLWSLVRMPSPDSAKPQWLLMKDNDAHARPDGTYDITVDQPDSVMHPPQKQAKPLMKRPGDLAGARRASLPDTLAPQLATLVSDIPSASGWTYELKLDGYRILARIQAGKVQFFTRTGQDCTAKLATQRAAVEQLGLDDAWIDGELVVFDADGWPSFQALQNAFDAKRSRAMCWVAFDLPFANGYDLRSVRLEDRRAYLRSLMQAHPSPVLRFSESMLEAPNRLLEAACSVKLEGLIAKRSDAPYVSGRTKDWVKLKCHQRQEFIIGGFTDPSGTRQGLGALLLGVYDDQQQLRYTGRVGTGFNTAQLAQMRQGLESMETSTPPFSKPSLRPLGAQRGVHWVQPKWVAEVAFAQWTDDGLVRQAVFQGLRMDKPTQDIHREAPATLTQAQTRSQPKVSKPATPEQVQGIAITHGERIIDSDSGVTKAELAQYYDIVAPVMLSHLRGRPVSVVRAPDGIQGELFFQKHMQGKGIPHLRALAPELDPGHAPLVVAENAQALVSAAQMNAVEFHTWNALARSIERPDRIVFDLDPDPDLPWARVIEAAELTKNFLDALGLVSFLKTSGGKGLHIVVPILRRFSWDQAKAFSQAVSQHLARTLPDRFSAKMGASNRIGKVFVDYLRNTRGASTVAAYSARARPGLPISVPLSWDELVELKSSAQWTIRNVEERLSALPSDPWADYESQRQSLTQAMKQLEIV